MWAFELLALKCVCVEKRMNDESVGPNILYS